MKEEKWVTLREVCRLLDTTSAGFRYIRGKHKFKTKVLNPNYTNPSKLYLEKEIIPFIGKYQKPHLRKSNWYNPEPSRQKTKLGYIMILARQHPHANCQGLYPEHRLVMEEKLGRLLHPKEVVHHINHDKADNSPENLYLYKDQAEHLIKGHEIDKQISSLCLKVQNRLILEKVIGALYSPKKTTKLNAFLDTLK